VFEKRQYLVFRIKQNQRHSVRRDYTVDVAVCFPCDKRWPATQRALQPTGKWRGGRPPRVAVVGRFPRRARSIRPRRRRRTYGQVEDLAEAVGVDGRQLPLGVQDRADPRKRAAAERGSRLTVMRRPRGPRNVRSTPERNQKVTRSAPSRVGQREDRHPDPGDG